VLFFRANNDLTDTLVEEGKGPRKGTPEYPVAIVKRLRESLRNSGIAPGLEGAKHEDIGEVVFF
jgi:hypothetical protein